MNDKQIEAMIDSGELSRAQVEYAKRGADSLGVSWWHIPPADFIALARRAPERPDDLIQQTARAWAERNRQAATAQREADKALAVAPLPDEAELREQATRLQVDPEYYIAAHQAQRQEAAGRVEAGREAERQAKLDQIAREQKEAFDKAMAGGVLWEIVEIGRDTNSPHHQAAREEVSKQLPSYEWPLG
jgi:hypothetical protein